MATPVALTGTIGEKIIVRASAVDGYGLTPTSAPVWTTDTASVAVVYPIKNQKGRALIRCLSLGTATITATVDSVDATFELTVIDDTPGDAVAVEVKTAT